MRRPPASAPDLRPFEGLRQRTPDSGPFTVVAHNLFMFNEGPAITMHNGTIGLEIFRNVIAGNGAGIVVIAGDNTHFYDEWTVEDSTDGTPYEYIEQGCYRIYRNLIVNNNKVDKDCGVGGSGVGIEIDADGIIEVRDQDDDEDLYLRMRASSRVRDVWIANNVVAGHGKYGVSVYRTRFKTGSDGAVYQSQVLGLRLLNNLIVNNNLGNEGDKFPTQLYLGGPGDTSFEDVELETFEVNHNWYYPPMQSSEVTDEEVTVAFNGDPVSLEAFHETSPERRFERIYFRLGPDDFRLPDGSGPSPVFDAASRVVIDKNLVNPELADRKGIWAWTLDHWDEGWEQGLQPGLWWADELSMPAGETARPWQWRTLPAAVWAPGSVDLAGTSAPPVGWQTGSVGIPDRGWYLRTGELVDVGEGPDIFYNPLGTEQRYEDGRMIIQTRAAAVGAWNPRTSEERPFHWSEVEPSLELGEEEDRPFHWPGLEPTVTPQGPVDSDRRPPGVRLETPMIDWESFWNTQQRLRWNTWPSGIPQPFAEHVDVDTLRWAARAGYVGRSRQASLRAWGRRHGS